MKKRSNLRKAWWIQSAGQCR